MGNILPTVHLIEEGHIIKILNKRQKIYLISKSIYINDCKSHTISLIPLKNSHINNTEGLKWKLKNENINMFQSRTLRNIALSNQVKIDISSGVLMVIESW